MLFIVFINIFQTFLICIDTFGYRSPSFSMQPSGGNTSPGQGRSLREHDEQLNTLRKENFNLKLRIYFLEEKNPSGALSEGSEALYKQNVDLKVNIATIWFITYF